MQEFYFLHSQSRNRNGDAFNRIANHKILYKPIKEQVTSILTKKNILIQWNPQN